MFSAKKSFHMSNSCAESRAGGKNNSQKSQGGHKYAYVEGIAYNRLQKERPTRIAADCCPDDVDSLYNDPAVMLTQVEAGSVDLYGLAIKVEHGGHEEFGDDIVGKVIRQSVGGAGKNMNIVAEITNPRAREMLKSGELRAFSVGYNTMWDGNSGEVNGKRWAEISLVKTPYFKGCNITAVAASSASSGKSSSSSPPPFSCVRECVGVPGIEEFSTDLLFGKGFAKECEQQQSNLTTASRGCTSNSEKSTLRLFSFRGSTMETSQAQQTPVPMQTTDSGVSQSEAQPQGSSSAQPEQAPASAQQKNEAALSVPPPVLQIGTDYISKLPLTMNLAENAKQLMSNTVQLTEEEYAALTQSTRDKLRGMTEAHNAAKQALDTTHADMQILKQKADQQQQIHQRGFDPTRKSLNGFFKKAVVACSAKGIPVSADTTLASVQAACTTPGLRDHAILLSYVMQEHTQLEAKVQAQAKQIEELTTQNKDLNEKLIATTAAVGKARPIMRTAGGYSISGGQAVRFGTSAEDERMLGKRTRGIAVQDGTVFASSSGDGAQKQARSALSQEQVSEVAASAGDNEITQSEIDALFLMGSSVGIRNTRMVKAAISGRSF